MRFFMLPVLVTAAAAPWSEPQIVTAPGSPTSPAIDFGADGAALVSWTGIGARSVGFATVMPDGRAIERPSSAGALASRPQLYGRDRVVWLGRRDLARDPARPPDPSGSAVRLEATFGTTRSPAAGAPERIADYRTAPGDTGPADVDVAESRVAAAWVDYRRRPDISDSIIRVRVALGSPSRGFDRPRTLASGRLPRFDSRSRVVVVYAGDDLVVAYSTTRRLGRRLQPIVAARIARRGRSFGPAQNLGPRRQGTGLVGAAASDGRTVVAWSSEDMFDQSGSPYAVRAAVRPAGRSRFARAQLLDPGDSRAQVLGRLSLDMSRDGRATLAWSNVTLDGRLPVRTVSTGPTGRFGPVTQLASHGAVADVAVAGDGSTLVAWHSRDPQDDDAGQGRLLAAIRPAGAVSFGAPEQVLAMLPSVDAADVAYDVRTGWPTAVAGPLPGGVLVFTTRTG